VPNTCSPLNNTYGYPVKNQAYYRRCGFPSGPVIATSGFGKNAQWVSPKYYKSTQDPIGMRIWDEPVIYGGARRQYHQSRFDKRYFQRGGYVDYNGIERLNDMNVRPANELYNAMANNGEVLDSYNNVMMKDIYNLQPMPDMSQWAEKNEQEYNDLCSQLGGPYNVNNTSSGFAVWTGANLYDKYGGVLKRVELHDKRKNPLYTWFRGNLSRNKLKTIVKTCPDVSYDLKRRWLCVKGDNINQNLATATALCMYANNRLDINKALRLRKKYNKILDNDPRNTGTFVSIINRNL
jgi:hypothetical protein